MGNRLPVSFLRWLLLRLLVAPLACVAVPWRPTVKVAEFGSLEGVNLRSSIAAPL
jgi:hypothetical protein